MIGLSLPDHARLSPRVATVLGQNPGPFTGPGTNTYLVGVGRRPILLDTGQGVAIYPEKLAEALGALCDSDSPGAMLLTHAHPDHIGGVAQVRARYGMLRVLKLPWAEKDAPGDPITPIARDAIISDEGITLEAVFTPGHAPDHLCYYLKEEKALFTGDVVLGAGTTVIPDETGDLGQYLDSLRRLLALEVETIYPAHGPVIHNPKEKIQEYIAHRELREKQVFAAVADGLDEVMKIVERIYVDVPKHLHQAAANSVRSHLKKLRNDGRVVQHGENWTLTA